MHRVVIAEPFAQSGIALLEQHGIQPDLCVGASRSELIERLQGADGLVVRSETHVDRALLEHANDLAVVARAGVGVDAIDVEAATSRGIVVVNTPGANSIAATEQTFALMLAAMRKLPFAHASVHSGQWDRKPFIGRELYGKTLGIIGLGRIGSAVALRAIAFGMKPVAYDPYIPAARARAIDVELLELTELLARADIITLHVPSTPQTKNMIDAAAFKHMKPSALLVNCARGNVVDIDALLAAIDEKRLSGAAIDVIPQEPPPPGSSSARALTHPQIVATPHLGGSTQEALERIALELATDVVNVLAGRPAQGAVNAPRHTNGNIERGNAFTDLAFRMGRFLPQVFDDANGGEIALALHGEAASFASEPFVAAVLAGMLPLLTDRRVSIVNAVEIARDLGVRITVQTQDANEYTAAILATPKHRIVGTVAPSIAPSAKSCESRIIAIDGFEVDAIPTGNLLITRHRDVPGMVGQIGGILGSAHVNISTMQVARVAEHGDAMMVIEVDRNPGRDVLATIAQVPGVDAVRLAEI